MWKSQDDRRVGRGTRRGWREENNGICDQQGKRVWWKIRKGGGRLVVLPQIVVRATRKRGRRRSYSSLMPLETA